MKLFATDLDGTLLDNTGAIHPRDLEAIRRARQEGVIVTIATGRLTSRTHPIARALQLDAPLVCADGAVLACSVTEKVLRRRPLALPIVDHTLSLLREHSLSSFVLTHDAVHSCKQGVAHHGYMRGWSDAITTHADLCASPAWRSDEAHAVMVMGIGDPEDVESVARELKPLGNAFDLHTFEAASTGQYVVRLMGKGVSKGAALIDLAAELGVDPARIGVAGDWYNDVSMFAVAGHSFAMPHAPSDVKSAASQVLDSEAPRRGAIAEALECWLAELS